MPHDSTFVFSGICLFVERKINRLLRREPIMAGQRAEYLTGPVTELFLGRSGRIELGHGALPDNGTEVIDFGAKLSKHRSNKNFIFANSECLGGFHHHVNVAWWFGMYKLIRQFLSHGRHEVPMPAKKMYVFVIGRRFQGVDLNRVGGPVFEK